MKEVADRFTLPLEGVEKPRRGRPPKPDALTPAQRAKAYRARLKADPLRSYTQLMDKMARMRQTVDAEVARRILEKQDAQRAVTKVCTEEEWPYPKGAI